MNTSINNGVRSLNFFRILIIATVLLLALWTLAMFLPPRESNSSEDVSPPATSAIPPGQIKFAKLLDRDNWVVVEDQRVLKSINQGRTWTVTFPKASTPENSAKLRGLSFVDFESGYLVVSFDSFENQLIHTRDGGATWELIGPVKAEENFSVSGCYFATDSSGWIVGRIWKKAISNTTQAVQSEGLILFTEDGGKTWSRKLVETPSRFIAKQFNWGFRDIQFVNNLNGWIVGDGGIILATSDQGRSWHAVTTDDVDYRHVNFLDAQFGWATYRYGNSSWGIAISKDGGLTWNRADESLAYGTWEVQSVFLTPAHGFAMSGDLYETHDGGDSWKKISLVDKDARIDLSFLGKANDDSLIIFGRIGESFVVFTKSFDESVWKRDF
jgi:photosystem II stability/assembly factor-like uncharacterized protein